MTLVCKKGRLKMREFLWIGLELDKNGEAVQLLIKRGNSVSSLEIRERKIVLKISDSEIGHQGR